jgi:hypothetical protein
MEKVQVTKTKTKAKAPKKTSAKKSTKKATKKPTKKTATKKVTKKTATKKPQATIKSNHSVPSLRPPAPAPSPNSDVAIPLDLSNYQMQGTAHDYAKWDRKFTELMAKNIIPIADDHDKTKKIWRKIAVKKWFNDVFKVLHIKYRISTKEEYKVITDNMRKTFLDVFLHLNNLDDNSLKNIEEMRKNRSIEGIRGQLPHIDSESLRNTLVRCSESKSKG